MSTQHLQVTKFGGGISANTKSGLQGACRFSRNLSIYDDDDSVILNPAPAKVSGSTIVDLPMWGVDTNPSGTDHYYYGDAGNIYKETSGGAWSVDRTVSGGAGQGMEVLNGFLYYAGSTTLGRKGISPSVAYDDNFIQTHTLDVDVAQGGVANTYTVPTTIAETALTRLLFTPTTDPIKYASFFVAAKGTGDWTITVHDGLNNVLGTSTIVNGSLILTYNNFFFTSPVRVTLGKTYHFHITSTVADGTVGVATASDFSTGWVNTSFSPLIADTNFHPMTVFTNGQIGTLIIGNEHYLAQWDGVTYNPNQITFEPGFKVRTITRQNEFLVALAWHGANNDSYEEGRAYFWDGIQPYYNYYYPIMSGSPNAAINFKNRVFSILGSSGDLNLDTDPFHQIQPAPKLIKGKKVEVLPGAITVWQRRIHFGMWSADDSVGFEAGVYEYGNQSDRAITYTAVSTEVLNNSYQISTGTTKSTGVKIGLVKGWGKDLYIGWKDGAGYGMDKVSKDNTHAATGSWESLIIDEGVNGQNLTSMPQKTKMALKLVVTFAPLTSGATVVPKYKINRATNFTTTSLGGQAATGGTVTGDTRAELIIQQRYREIEIGFNLTSGSDSPIVTGIDFLWDALEAERSES